MGHPEITCATRQPRRQIVTVVPVVASGGGDHAASEGVVGVDRHRRVYCRRVPLGIVGIRVDAIARKVPRSIVAERAV